MITELFPEPTVDRLYIKTLYMTNTFAGCQKTIRQIGFGVGLGTAFLDKADLYCYLSMFSSRELAEKSAKYSHDSCSVQLFGNDVYRTAMRSIRNGVGVCRIRAVNRIPQFQELMATINVFLTNKR